MVVVATRNPADEAVSGSYEKDTFGLVGGVAAGHEAGRIRKEVGPVPVDVRIPGTAIPGAIIGGLFGGMQRYDVEIYDRDRLVLLDEGVSEPRYAVPMKLDCGDYRWSARPSWRFGGTVRYGRWMRFPPPPEDADEGEGEEQPPQNGLSGHAASQAPAYTQDFPSLTIACGRS